MQALGERVPSGGQAKGGTVLPPLAPATAARSTSRDRRHTQTPLEYLAHIGFQSLIEALVVRGCCRGAAPPRAAPRLRSVPSTAATAISKGAACAWLTAPRRRSCVVFSGAPHARCLQVAAGLRRPRDPLLFFSRCVEALLPGGQLEAEGASPPLKWDAFVAATDLPPQRPPRGAAGGSGRAAAHLRVASTNAPAPRSAKWIGLRAGIDIISSSKKGSDQEVVVDDKETRKVFEALAAALILRRPPDHLRFILAFLSSTRGSALNAIEQWDDAGAGTHTTAARTASNVGTLPYLRQPSTFGAAGHSHSHSHSHSHHDAQNGGLPRRTHHHHHHHHHHAFASLPAVGKKKGGDQVFNAAPFPMNSKPTAQWSHEPARAAAFRELEASALARVREKVKKTGQVSVFLSSPFKGLEAERNIFNRDWLPRLIRKAESKGVHFRALDLRWGISSEQRERDLLVYICLKEITDADFFIGIHGYRYVS